MPLFLRMTVYAQAARDPEIFRAVARRINLLDPADALAHNHDLLERARRLAQEAEPSPPAGPPRERLLEQLPLPAPA